MEATMKNHAAPAMHQHHMSMFERNMASASNRNTTPEHPNPESLIPSNLFDSLLQQPPSSPRYTYSSPRSVTTESHSTSTPYPHTPPYLFTPQPSQQLSSLVALSYRQQWVYCTPEQADRWKPRKNEIEHLNHKLRNNIHFASSRPADGEEVNEDSADSERKECQREEEAEEAEKEEEEVNVDDEKEEEEEQQQQRPTPPQPHQHPQAGQIPNLPFPIPHHTTTNTQNHSTLQYQKKEEQQQRPTPPWVYQHPQAGQTPYPRPGTLPYPRQRLNTLTPSNLYYLDYRLLEIQRQQRAAEGTYSARPKPYAHGEEEE